MTVKFGIKASSMLASLALATVFVAGCTEETPPETPKAGAAAPVAKPADAKPATPPATPSEKPKTP